EKHRGDIPQRIPALHHVAFGVPRVQRRAGGLLRLGNAVRHGDGAECGREHEKDATDERRMVVGHARAPLTRRWRARGAAGRVAACWYTERAACAAEAPGPARYGHVLSL